jgi:hypothetical protein
MEKKYEILLQSMLNYARLENDKVLISFADFNRVIADFNRVEAEEFGELMKQTFIKHWEKSKTK